MLFPSGNPFKCQEEVLYLQPLILPKRFDISPPPGSYGNKILYKNLNFFDKIFVRKSCRRRFRNATYGNKILYKNLKFTFNECSTFRKALLLREWYFFKNARSSAVRACAAHTQYPPSSRTNVRLKAAYHKHTTPHPTAPISD